MMLFIISAVVYVFILYLLIAKWKDIFSHPEKYDEIKGWRKYRKSFWYEPLEDYHKLLSKNWIAPIITAAPLFLALFVAAYFIARGIQIYLIIPSDALVCFINNEYWIGMIGVLFLSIVFSFWITFNLSWPVMIAATRSAFDSESRSTDWKKLIVSLTIVFAVLFPFYVLSLDSYGYATEDKIVYNEYFTLSERDYYFNDIVETQTSFRLSHKGGTDLSYVIRTSAGDELELYNVDKKTVLYVHNKLKSKGVNEIKGKIDADTYQKLLKGNYKADMEVINELFIVE